MINSFQDALINLIDEIRAIAQTGLNFTENPYDREHYQRLMDVASINLSELAGVDNKELSERFSCEIGYITPKLGINAAIFNDKQQILLEKRVDDGAWGLPSGWVEVGETLLQTVVREVKEETGLDVEPAYIINVYESVAFAPHRPHNAVGILYLCECKGGELRISHESTDIGYFNIDNVDNWHVSHKAQAERALQFIRKPDPFSAIRINRGDLTLNFFDLKNISERYLELINPTSPEKVLKIGKVLGLNKNSRVVEFGSGYGEILALWAEHFGISGIGVDIREHVCQRARKKMTERGFADRIEIVCGKGAEYEFEKHAFDVAACIGASFVWQGYRSAIVAMRDAIHEHGKLVIGEPYWIRESVPLEFAKEEQGIYTEYELLKIAREEGFDLEYVVRASLDDWDRYESDNWYGLIRWIEENPKHPERSEVIDHLHKSQNEYIRFGREYMGWAMYILTPVCY